MLNIQLYHHINKFDFKICSNRKQCFRNCNNISQYPPENQKKSFVNLVFFFMSLHYLEHKKKNGKDYF